MSNMASDAKACFSSKFEYRAVIRYLYLKSKTGKEIYGEIADVYGSSASSYARVKFWVREFKPSTEMEYRLTWLSYWYTDRNSAQKTMD